MAARSKRRRWAHEKATMLQSGWIEYENNDTADMAAYAKPKGPCAMLAAKSAGKGLRDADPGTAGEHLGGLRDVDHRDGDHIN